MKKSINNNTSSLFHSNKTSLICFCACVIAITLMLVPVFIYSFLSIPYADDFSYTSNIREAAEQYGGIIQGIFARIWFEYTTSEGGMYKVFCMTVGQIPFLKFGLSGLRIYILFCHIAFYIVLFWLVAVIIKRCVKKDTYNVILIVFTILIFWIINNQTNKEMYTWALIQSAYVIPIATMMLGIGLYIRHLDLPSESKRNTICFIFSAVCGLLASGSPLNIVILNCGFLFIVCYYGAKQGRSKYREWTVFGASLIGALINLIAPGNSARHGSEWGLIFFIKTILTALKHVIFKLGGYMSHTPFICLCIFLVFILYKSVEYNYDGNITYDHPVWFAGFCLTGAALVDWPYTFGNNIVELRNFEGRVDFVSDMSLYFIMILWVFYFVGYIKKNVITVKMQDSAKITRFVLGLLAVSSILIILSNGLYNYTTPYMISSLRNGSAKSYSDYQEQILEEIQRNDGEIHLAYDCSIVPKKHPIIIGLKLCDNPEDPSLFWQNNAVARYYFKSAVYIEYLN